jgi:uncharacterized membrane protein
VNPNVGAASPPPPERLPLRRRLRRFLITGLVILVPVTLTVYVLLAIFRYMDGIFAPVIDRFVGLWLPGVHIPGLGLLLTLLVVLLLGWLSTHVFGRRLIRGFDRLIARIPIAKSVYGPTKGVLEALSMDQADAFKRVVLIEYPKKDMFAIAFVTARAHWTQIDERMDDLLLVFLPTSPNPTSGYLLFVPRDEAIELPISVEDGVRLVITGGILQPHLQDLRPAP